MTNNYQKSRKQSEEPPERCSHSIEITKEILFAIEVVIAPLKL